MDKKRRLGRSLCHQWMEAMSKKKKKVMDTITRHIPGGEVIVLDTGPCPNETPNEDWVSKALNYYGSVYPDDYIDVDCNNTNK